MVHRKSTYVVVGVAILTSVGLVGCGGTIEKASPANRSYQNLKLLGMAYLAATNSLGRPPKDANELLPFIKYKGEGGPKSILQTAEGEEYTVLWGSPPGDEQKSFVIAYEPHETEGKRYVLVGRDVLHLNDEEFKKASFPPGKAP